MNCDQLFALLQEIQKLNIPWPPLASYLTIDNMQKGVPCEICLHAEPASYLGTLIIVHKPQSAWVWDCFWANFK